MVVIVIMHFDTYGDVIFYSKISIRIAFGGNFMSIRLMLNDIRVNDKNDIFSIKKKNWIE